MSPTPPASCLGTIASVLQVVKEDLKEDEAQELKAALEAAGATVELE